MLGTRDIKNNDAYYSGWAMRFDGLGDVLKDLLVLLRMLFDGKLTSKYRANFCSKLGYGWIFRLSSSITLEWFKFPLGIIKIFIAL